jgi:hypothetical protein
MGQRTLEMGERQGQYARELGIRRHGSNIYLFYILVKVGF